MRNLSYRKPRMPDLGKVFGIIYRANEKAIELHNAVDEDLRAFHAPSECAEIAYRGCDQIMLDAIKTAEAVTGMKWVEILAEVKARTGGRWLDLFVFESMLPNEGV